MTPKHTLIYPQKQDAGRAQSRPPGATMGGPVPNGPLSQARASSCPCPATLIALSLEGNPPPVSGGSRKFAKTSSISGFTQSQYLGTYPKKIQFSRIEFRWDFIPGRDHISVRLRLGLRNLPQASRSPQRARIREDMCLPCVCQTPPRGARSGAPRLTPLQRGRFMCGPGAPWTTSQGGCPTLPP